MFHNKLNGVINCFTKIKEILYEEKYIVKFEKDKLLFFFLILSAPFTWKCTDQLINLLLFKMQNNQEFLSNALDNIDKIFAYNEIQKISKKTNPRLFTTKSLFSFNIEDCNSKEILNNYINIKLISLEYLYKILIILIHQIDAKKYVNINLNLGKVFKKLFQNTENPKILKKAYKIFSEIGFQKEFYEKEQDFQELEDKIINNINEYKDSADSSFEKENLDLSDLIDQSDDQQEEIQKNSLYENEKEYLENLLIQNNLSVAKSEKFNNFFTRSIENLNTLLMFLTMPSTFEVGKEFSQYCQNLNLKTFPNVYQNLKLKENDEDHEQKHKEMYYRSFLAFMFLKTKGNHEFLLNISINYFDKCFELIYNGLKSKQCSLDIILHLLEAFIFKIPVKTVALILKFNLPFYFLKKITNPKSFDFLTNLINPYNKVFDFNEALFVQIWLYMKHSGFFKDVVESIINPKQLDSNIKFDKFFCNTDIKNIIEQLLYNELKLFSAQCKYENIKNTFLKKQSFYNPLFINNHYGIDNDIDFPPKNNDTKKNLNIRKNSTELKKFKSCINKSNDKKQFMQVCPENSLNIINENSKEQYRKQILSKKNSLKIQTKKQNINKFDYYYKIITKNFKENQVSDIKNDQNIEKRKSKSKILSKVKKLQTTLKIKESLKNILTKTQINEKVNQFLQFEFLMSDDKFADGYLGKQKNINIYPSYGHGTKENNFLYIDDTEKYLKGLNFKKFQQSECHSYQYAKFVYFLIKDIIQISKSSHLSKKLQFNNINSYILWQNLFDMEDQFLLKNMILNFIYKIDFIYQVNNPLMTSPIISAEIIILIIEFTNQHTFGEKYKNCFKIILKEYFYIFQEKFFLMFKHYQQKKISNDLHFETQQGIIRDPVGYIRQIYVNLLFSISDLDMTEEDYFEVYNIKVIQIIFLWIFEKKHCSVLSIQFLKFIKNLFKIKADKFITEITLKLDFFGIISDVLRNIYINEILIKQKSFFDILSFIRQFIIIYLSTFDDPKNFDVLINVLEKVKNFQYIVNSLGKQNKKNIQRKLICYSS